MSGGSYNYLYEHIESAAETVIQYSNTPERKAFAAHLRLVAKAMHEIEWVDSCDHAPGREIEAIRACLDNAGGAQAAILCEALKRAAVAARELLEAIDPLSLEGG